MRRRREPEPPAWAADMPVSLKTLFTGGNLSFLVWTGQMIPDRPWTELFGAHPTVIDSSLVKVDLDGATVEFWERVRGESERDVLRNLYRQLSTIHKSGLLGTGTGRLIRPDGSPVTRRPIDPGDYVVAILDDGSTLEGVVGSDSMSILTDAGEAAFDPHRDVWRRVTSRSSDRANKR